MSIRVTKIDQALKSVTLSKRQKFRLEFRYRFLTGKSYRISSVSNPKSKGK